MAIEIMMFGSDGVTAMAVALEVAMACDEAAQARYLAIYGEPFFADDSATLSGKSAAPTTTQATNLAKGTR